METNVSCLSPFFVHTSNLTNESGNGLSPFSMHQFQTLFIERLEMFALVPDEFEKEFHINSILYLLSRVHTYLIFYKVNVFRHIIQGQLQGWTEHSH